jgi:hypothetical protein
MTTMPITLDQFLTGAPLPYRSIAGERYTARWLRLSGEPMPSLEVRDSEDRRHRWFFMPEHEARNFYAHIASDPTAYLVEG